MLRTLKFCGFILLNLIAAIIGTAILDTEVRRMIPSHSIAAVIWKEIILSIICAASIGFGIWRTWRNSASKWTWVLPLIWFAFGYVAIVGHGGQVFGSIFGSNPGVPEVRSFFAFTIPLIRAASYSAGAYISSLLYPAPVAHNASDN